MELCSNRGVKYQGHVIVVVVGVTYAVVKRSPENFSPKSVCVGGYEKLGPEGF